MPGWQAGSPVTVYAGEPKTGKQKVQLPKVKQNTLPSWFFNLSVPEVYESGQKAGEAEDSPTTHRFVILEVVLHFFGNVHSTYGAILNHALNPTQPLGHAQVEVLVADLIKGLTGHITGTTWNVKHRGPQ